MKTKTYAICAIALLAPHLHAATCNTTWWTNFKGVDVFRIGAGPAYAYITTHAAVDADGAPNAYHPDDTGLDKLANAGYPGTSWWSSVLVPHPQDAQRAYVQLEGAYKGYFVAKTSLSDSGKAATDPSRYVDSNAVPYVVLPTLWYPVKGSGSMGDLAYARTLDGSRTTEAILADTGGGQDARLGEASIELFRRLGDPQPSPRKGLSKPLGPIIYVVFPRSRLAKPWPLAADQLKKLANAQLQTAGGWPSAECLKR